MTRMASAPGTLRVEIEQAEPMPLHGTFSCEPGEMMALVGPSGAGKTSMLRCLAGLMRPQQGRIAVGDHTWVDTAARICLPPQDRHVGLVFQNYALMPHLTALDNVALALLHLPAAERRQRAARWLDQVRLSPEQQARRPAALSGGQQQRVAVARALAREPRLLLLDEPFSAVDQMNRQGLYDTLAELRQNLRMPIVLVTHDLVEARQLADRLVVMDSGAVLQQGTPSQIYRSPRNARVADLVGVLNRFKGLWLGPLSPQDTADQAGWLQWVNAHGQPTDLRLRVRDKQRLQRDQPVTWVIQGDGLRMATERETGNEPEANASVALEGTVVASRNLGETTLAQIRIDGLEGDLLRLTRSGPGRRKLDTGQRLTVWLDCDWVHVMPTRAG